MSLTYHPLSLHSFADNAGIGNAIAQAFVREGCTKIIITDINPTSLSLTRTQLLSLNPSTQILDRVINVADPLAIDTLFDEIKHTFGRIDYAVNNAGIMGPFGTSTDISLGEFDQLNNVNYRGLWICERRELELMKLQEYLPGSQGGRRQRGSIVNIASQLGIVGRSAARKSPLPAYLGCSCVAIYCAAKSAVIGLTRCDAIDHAEYGIRVNAVCPGVIGTPMTIRSTSDTDNAEVKDPFPHLRKEIDASPMKRVGTPEEIADVVLFLSSEKASFVQGASWVVDGGYIIQ